jgi:hypothetical protein
MHPTADTLLVMYINRTGRRVMPGVRRAGADRLFDMNIGIAALMFSCIALLGCAGDVLAQARDSDRCTVSAQPMIYESPDRLRVTINSTKVLGTFDTVAAAGALTSKIYRLPRTRLFVFAIVRYDEDVLTEQNPGLISMRLFVTGKKRDDWLTGVAVADAEIPYDTFGTGKREDSTVSTLIKVKGRLMMEVAMSCRKDSRR